MGITTPEGAFASKQVHVSSFGAVEAATTTTTVNAPKSPKPTVTVIVRKPDGTASIKGTADASVGATRGLAKSPPMKKPGV